jgi:hypothetical protein
LKFSTGGDYFNAGSLSFQGANFWGDAICKKKRPLQNGARPPSLATALHIATATPTRANQTRGNKNGKEDLEEGKEDRSDEAVDGSGQVSTGYHARRLTLLQERGVRALESFSWKRADAVMGRPFSRVCKVSGTNKRSREIGSWPRMLSQ